MIKLGSKAPKAVTLLQTQLKKLGYDIDVDGHFGSQTADVVRKFQAANYLKADGIVGSGTKAVIDRLLDDAGDDDDAPEVKTDAKNTSAPWMELAKKHLGQREIKGQKDNPFIVGLFHYTSLGHGWHDETPWCAAFVSAMLEQSNYKSTHSASAASYDHFGHASHLVYGAIVTIGRTGGSGRHVTFFSHFDKAGNLVCLGGNQSDMVKYSTFKRSKVAQVRWPK